MIELKTYGGARNGTDMGFEKEDGFTASTVPSGADAFKDEGQDTDESADF